MILPFLTVISNPNAGGDCQFFEIPNWRRDMTHIFKEFLSNEDGASTVDMTMLTAALVGLSLSVATLVSTGVEVSSGDIQTILLAQDTGPAF